MGELLAPDFRNQPWCIYEDPELENISINTSVVHNLPKFSGAHGESATTHLQRLHGICQNLKPNGVNVEDFKLKAFYFYRVDSANDWFLSLPSGSIRTWAQMQKKFLDKYYPAGRAMQVRRELQDIRQGPNETMYDYLEKFNRLERSCCTLGLPEKLIIEYLIDGLTPLDKKLLDASAGGSMMRLSLSGIRRLITDVAENARFREETTRQDEFSRTKNVARAETSVNSMPEEMKQIKEMMIQILQRQPAQMRPCEFCGSTDHKTDACPTNEIHAQREIQQSAPQPAQSFYQPPHRQYNQNSPPVGQYQQRGPNQYPTGQYQQKGQNQYQASPSNQQGPSKSLEDVVKELASSIHQLRVETKGDISDLKKQMSQLATSMSVLTNEPGRLPSQTVQNPKANISMIKMSDMKGALEEAARPTTYKLTAKHFTRRHRLDWNQKEDRPNDGKTWVTHADNGRYTFTVNMTPPPMTHFNVPASGWDDNEDLDSDGPRWDSPSNICASEQSNYLEDQELNGSDPANLESEEDAESTDYKGSSEQAYPEDFSYSMQMVASKDHAIQKNEEEIRLKPKNGQNGSIMERSLATNHVSQPEKGKDPGAFMVTCGIGESEIHHCLIDLEAAANVLPYHLYCSLGLGPLKPPKLFIELGDKSCICPVGVFEDLILRVGKLVVTADFYVIQTGDTSEDVPPTIILGWPFLYATRARIDMGESFLSLAFGGRISDFYIDDNNGRPSTRKPSDIVHTSDLSTLVSDLPRETVRVTRPAAMVKTSSPTWEDMKENPPGQWSLGPSTSSRKKSGKVKVRINAGAAAKFDLSRPWDPDPS
ncbi:unnamed protein product [Rhodiola kirilowii]